MSTTCIDCLAARSDLVARATDATVHHTPEGWVRARYVGGQWRPAPGESTTDMIPYVTSGPGPRGVAELATMGVRSYETAEEALQVDHVRCERHTAERTEEYADLAGALRTDARLVAMARTRKTRPLADLVAEIRAGKHSLALATVEAQGVDLAGVTVATITDDVVWAAWLAGVRAPGGAERYERGLTV